MRKTLNQWRGALMTEVD